MRVITIALTATMLFGAGCKGDPATPEYWQKTIPGTKRTDKRVQAVQALRESSSLNATWAPMIHELLAAEKKPQVKGALARVLGELGDPSSVQPLADALELNASDTDAHAANKEIASALARIGDAKATPTLLKLLRSTRDNYTKIEVINALGALRAKEATATLMGIATDMSGEAFIQKKAIQALGNIGNAEAVPALVRMMFEERPGISFYVESSFALYQMGAPAADALLPVLMGKDQALFEWASKKNRAKEGLYAKAAQVLGDLHDKRAEANLLEKLKYESQALDMQLIVRMYSADALGRMRSAAGAKAIAAMVEEEEANARSQYVRSLVRIGGREAVPALTKAANTGSWDARDVAMMGLAMLGDERELPVFEKLAKSEEAMTTAECKENPNYRGCDAPAELVKKHVEAIQLYAKRLEAARDAKDAAGWIKKLDDADAGVRERAGYELGRSGDGAAVEKLLAKLTEENLDARLAFIQAVDWLVEDNKDAAAKAKSALPALFKQIEEERGKTQFVKVNEDLRRLAVKIARAS